jgi:putative phosphoesterase
MVEAVTTIGVISDTHGLVRPEVRAALAGVERIIHAGDLDEREVLEMLGCIAPLTAVRGNCDRGAWARALPESVTITFEGLAIHVVHDIYQLGMVAKSEGVAAVVCGHSHRPRNEVRDGVLYFNPGSAGPRRFHCPVSLGKLHVEAGEIRGEIITLEEASR